MRSLLRQTPSRPVEVEEVTIRAPGDSMSNLSYHSKKFTGCLVSSSTGHTYCFIKCRDGDRLRFIGIGME